MLTKLVLWQTPTWDKTWIERTKVYCEGDPNCEEDLKSFKKNQIVKETQNMNRKKLETWPIDEVYSGQRVAIFRFYDWWAEGETNL